MALKGVVHPARRDLKIRVTRGLGPFQALFTQLFPRNLILDLKQFGIVGSQVEIGNELGFHVGVFARLVALHTERL